MAVGRQSQRVDGMRCQGLRLGALSLGVEGQPPSLETWSKCWGGPQGGGRWSPSPHC